MVIHTYAPKRAVFRNVALLRNVLLCLACNVAWQSQAGEAQSLPTAFVARQYNMKLICVALLCLGLAPFSASAASNATNAHGNADRQIFYLLSNGSAKEDKERARH